MENIDKEKLIETGKRVLRRESEALTKASETLDEQFANAVELMLNAKGRVVVSGMGKSGHVGKKIVATLASTGTPAQFVHPAEASHGDLGMLTRDDVLLMLSNSGETPELANMLSYARRFGIKLIAIAGNINSSLMQHADVPLLLPDVTEACEQGIVPTTSTTMTIALGDALAVALMEQRNFTPENFREFHPGGNLGAKLALVSDLMHHEKSLPLVVSSEKMTDVLLTISQKGFGVAGVVNDEKIVGIITDGDLRRNMSGLLEMDAKEVMTSNPFTIQGNLLASEAVAIMNSKKITCLFVVNNEQDNKPIGLIHIHDCLRAGIV